MGWYRIFRSKLSVGFNKTQFFPCGRAQKFNSVEEQQCVHSKLFNYRTGFATARVYRGAMTDKLPPHLLNLFTPRPPLRYLLPADTAPEKRKTATVSGIAAILSQIASHDQDYTPTDTADQLKEKRRAGKQIRNQKLLRDAIENCMFSSAIVAFL